jgi:hypothetical protein
MKKVKDNELTELTGGMTCARLSEILDGMMYGENASQQSWDQAIIIIDLIDNGYTLCTPV